MLHNHRHRRRESARGTCLPAPPKIGKYFSGNYHVKFGHFANFSCTYFWSFQSVHILAQFFTLSISTIFNLQGRRRRPPSKYVPDDVALARVVNGGQRASDGSLSAGCIKNTTFSAVAAVDKKAVLSQRWPHNAPCPENFHDSLTTPTASIPNIFHGLLLRSTLWMFLQNLKCIALPIPEIIGGTPKNWAAPGYAHVPFPPKFLMGFYSHWPCKLTRQIRSLWLYPFQR